MKRLILSVSLVTLGLASISPAVLAGQASTPGQISDAATVIDLVRYNRDVRGK
ncbi:MAG: hypothetical protein HLUCCA11_16315 [Phormidesmis priestleyi Ana]|uniref:Uncharacterized protein n=1 Tax=Phormidesmis priestleyi Ana TaxID=1666911 RepID=A0A0P7YTU2_9CYAN|nr:MAG: hypothetical protein HLUCCA11_16315 [Phormidesmis priestleyi Ana]